MNEITRSEGYKVWVEREVLYRDMDLLGHMNNVTPLYYFEDARVEYWRRLHMHVVKEEWSTIIARVECDYLGQAFMGEKLIVAIKTSQIGTRSYTFEYLITEKESGRVVCRGRSVAVCFEYDAQKSCLVPDDLIESIEAIEEGQVPRKNSNS